MPENTSTYLGNDVVIRGTMIVGTSYPSNSIYVFRKESGSWQAKAILNGSIPNPRDQFGSSVVLLDDQVVVGAYGLHYENLIYAGGVYVFVLVIHLL